MEDRYGKSNALNNIDKDTLSILRGFSILIIILSHIVQDASIVLRIILPSNIAIFVFSTAYGLLFQYEKNRDVYLQGFVREKILKKILSPFILYGLIETITNNLISKDGTIFRPSIWMNWYVLFTVYIYLVFWIIFTKIKKQAIQVVAAIVSVIIYTGGCLVLDLSSTWYQAVILLLVATLFVHDNMLTRMINNHRGIAFIISFVFMHVFNLMTFDVIDFPLSGTIGAEFVCVFTAISMVTLPFSVKSSNVISSYLRWVGVNSYRFYLIHPMLILICRHFLVPAYICYVGSIVFISLYVYLIGKRNKTPK